MHTRIPSHVGMDPERIFHLPVYFSPDGESAVWYTDDDPWIEDLVKESRHSDGSTLTMHLCWCEVQEREDFLKETGYIRRYVEAIKNHYTGQWVMAFHWPTDKEWKKIINVQNRRKSRQSRDRLGASPR